MKSRNLILAIICMLVLLGCSATGPIYTRPTSVSESNALLLLYRPAQMKGMVISPPVYIDDQEMFEIANGSYAELSLIPGKHVIETRKVGRLFSADAKGIAEITVEAGQTYYVRWSPVQSDFGITPGTMMIQATFSGAFSLVPEGAALEQIKACRKVYPKQ